MNIDIHVNYSLFLSDFKETWIFASLWKNTEIYNFVKIRTVGAELFRADGQKSESTDERADMTELVVAFRNFTNTPKNSLLLMYNNFKSSSERYFS